MATFCHISKTSTLMLSVVDCILKSFESMRLGLPSAYCIVFLLLTFE